MLKIKNTALDPMKSLLHRKAAKLEMEPMINGQRLRLRTSVDVPEDWANKNRDYLEKLVKQGVIEIEYSKTPDREPALNEQGLKLGGPTLEEFMKRGYPADRYPPAGWAEVPSAGLTAYRKELEEKAAAEAKAKEEAELAAMIAAEEEAKAKAAAEAAASVIQDAAALPSVTSQILPPTPIEPAGAPVAEVPPPPAAPAVEEKKEEGKKGSGKSKLK